MHAVDIYPGAGDAVKDGFRVAAHKERESNKIFFLRELYR
jgi:hypothetical protein